MLASSQHLAGVCYACVKHMSTNRRPTFIDERGPKHTHTRDNLMNMKCVRRYPDLFIINISNVGKA